MSLDFIFLYICLLKSNLCSANTSSGAMNHSQVCGQPNISKYYLSLSGFTVSITDVWWFLQCCTKGITKSTQNVRTCLLTDCCPDDACKFRDTTPSESECEDHVNVFEYFYYTQHCHSISFFFYFKPVQQEQQNVIVFTHSTAVMILTYHIWIITVRFFFYLTFIYTGNLIETCGLIPMWDLK